VLRFPGEWSDLEQGDCTLERFHVCRS
jgi:hypothetical protein